MADNDPIIGSVLFAIDMLLREVAWKATAEDDSEKAQEYAEFADSLMEDMSITWEDFISEVLSMLVYGWSFFE
ncbi:MAG: hypothetical protein J0626_09745, partial [Rhodospirillaceae bacterium]|nr:hypothetical protein [Rhodospirillaceae bacterium]